MNIQSEHWFVCDRHKTTWCVGSNLFSGWRDEDEATWERNRLKLAEYMTVEPMRRGTAEQLRASMRRHWMAGLRPPEFQQAVRRDCPAATLDGFNAAIDEVWAELGRADEETVPCEPGILASAGGMAPERDGDG